MTVANIELPDAIAGDAGLAGDRSYDVTGAHSVLLANAEEHPSEPPATARGSSAFGTWGSLAAALRGALRDTLDCPLGSAFDWPL